LIFDAVGILETLYNSTLRSFKLCLVLILALGLRRFSVCGPRLWNELPYRHTLVPHITCFWSSFQDILLPPSHGQVTPVLSSRLCVGRRICARSIFTDTDRPTVLFVRLISQ